MSEEKQTTRGRYTEAQRKATNKYRQERAQIVVLMTKGQREQIKQAATDAGMSINQYIINQLFG